jgi:SMI1/KNR4 family protein SUKH-1
MATIEDVRNFWFSEGTGATAADLDRAEKYVGHPIPQRLRALLEVKNGGVSVYSAFIDEDRYYPLLPLFGVDPEVAAGSLMRAFDVRAEFGVPDGVVPFAGQGNAWMGLDFRQSGLDPAVVYRDDIDREIEEVAKNFDAFIQGLVEE